MIGNQANIHFFFGGGGRGGVRMHVFHAQAECFYFSPDLKLKISWKYTLKLQSIVRRSNVCLQGCNSGRYTHKWPQLYTFLFCSNIHLLVSFRYEKGKNLITALSIFSVLGIFLAYSFAIPSLDVLLKILLIKEECTEHITLCFLGRRIIQIMSAY